MPGKDMTQVTSYDQTGSLPSVLSAKRDKNPRALDSPTRKARRRELTRKLHDLKNCVSALNLCAGSVKGELSAEVLDKATVETWRDTLFQMNRLVEEIAELVQSDTI